jgi:hypothetical protein
MVLHVGVLEKHRAVRLLFKTLLKSSWRQGALKMSTLAFHIKALARQRG